MAILNQAVPNIGGLTKSASSIIGNALTGRLPAEATRNINNAAALQSVASGMPGTNMMSGTLFGNRTLRDIGVSTLGRQQQGFQDLLSLLGGVSGTIAPTFAQTQDQANTVEQYRSAPVPSVAANQEQSLYEKYANPGQSWWQRAYNMPQIPQTLRTDRFGITTDEAGRRI
jgi:hypothetical protein